MTASSTRAATRSWIGFETRLRLIRDIVGLTPGARDLAALSLLITSRGHFFFADTHVRVDPTAAEVANVALQVAEHVGRFGLTPKVALLSDSDFGGSESVSALKMREALAIIRAADPDLEIDGEMQADSALSQTIRDYVMPGSNLKGEANVLLFPSLEAANIGFQLVKVLADALPVGPILMGAARPAHILTPSVTVRGIINMTAIAVGEAQSQDRWDPA